MNRRLATKSDLADIITSGGGTFSSSSNEILTSSYINNLSSDSIGGTLTLTYSVESTDRSSYLSNECVLYEDITFTKESGPITQTYTITYKASTGVSGSDVTEEVEENTIYTPQIPSSFTLVSGYEEPMICDPSEEFIVTENKTILVSATKSSDLGEYEFAFYRDYDVDSEGNTNWIGFIGNELTTYVNSIIDGNNTDIKICSRNISDSNWRFIQYSYDQTPSWASINESDGGIVISPTEINYGEERSFDITFTQNESNKTIVLHVIQISNKDVLLADFDDLIITYEWGEDDGVDLDTATRIGYKELNSDTVKYIKYVGFGQTNNDTFYTKYGGDNRTSGNETSVIRLKEYLNNYHTGVQKQYIQIEARANWFEEKGTNHKCIMKYSGYKGGDISQSGFIFTSSGELVVSDNKQVDVYAVGQANYKMPERWYTRTLIIKYFPNSKSVIATFGLDINNTEDLKETGWDVNNNRILGNYYNITKEETYDPSNWLSFNSNNFYISQSDVNESDNIELKFKIVMLDPYRIMDYMPTSIYCSTIENINDYFQIETDESGESVYKINIPNYNFTDNASANIYDITPYTSVWNILKHVPVDYRNFQLEPTGGIKNVPFDSTNFSASNTKIFGSQDEIDQPNESWWATCKSCNSGEWTGYFNSRNSSNEKSNVTCIQKPDNVDVTISEVDAYNKDYDITVTLPENNLDFAIRYELIFKNEDGLFIQCFIYQRGRNQLGISRYSINNIYYCSDPPQEITIMHFDYPESSEQVQLYGIINGSQIVYSEISISKPNETDTWFDYEYDSTTGLITITATENTNPKERSGYLDISFLGKEYHFEIYQNYKH